MIIVGLTGGIGSGKSTVAKVFETLGIKIYNSDERAKELYFVPEIKEEIEKLLGKEVYVNETTLNKKYISEKIFSDNELLKQVNAIIHTEVKKDSDAFAEMHANQKYIIKESALLVEAKLLSSIDKLLVVTSNTGLRKQRVALRDGLSEAEINKRMTQQVPEEEKIKLADWVLENNEEDLLIPQIMKIHKSLMA
ncbi:MAG TPA: dephospho-CoA kinase [Bacteroidia bacterium]|jgi:dephospho-CoA kinase|nr:dephospho-CoA kinase [Bacteroidia bacterium]